MPDYGIFRTNDAKRIAAATRIVEGLPRSFLGVPQQIANRWTQPGTTTTGGDGFPDGVTCDCDHCLEGVTIPDGTECCKSHTTWSFTNPWLTCETTDLLLHYAGTDSWVSDEFSGPEGDPNTYRWVLTIDVDGVLAGVPNYTALTLTVAQDNGGDAVCLVYGRVGFDCQCDNSLTRKKPYGKVHGIELNDTSCNVCLKPDTTVDVVNCGTQEFPEQFILEIPCTGIDSFTCPTAILASNCDSTPSPLLEFGGVLGTSNFQPDCSWRVYQTFLDIGDDCCSLQYAIGYRESGFPVCGSQWMMVVHWHNPALASGEYWEYCPDSGGFDPQTGGTFDWTGGPYSGPPCTTITVTAFGSVSATDSGACEDEDCIPGIPPTNPSGGCCFGGYCLDFIDEALCNEFGGGWSADIDNCLELCNPTGACCVAGGCFLGTQQVCDLVGGTFVPGAHCDDDPCTDGACCRADGTCEVVPEGDCQGVGEHYYGDGTTCAGKSCLGACCCDDTPCCPGSSYTAEQCLGGPAGEPPCGGAGWTFHIDEDCSAACVSTASC